MQCSTAAEVGPLKINRVEIGAAELCPDHESIGEVTLVPLGEIKVWRVRRLGATVGGDRRIDLCSLL